LPTVVEPSCDDGRALDPAELYYAALDAAYPMNVVTVAELAIAPDPADVSAAWTAVRDRFALAAARLDAGAGVVAGAVPAGLERSAATSLDELIAAEQAEALDLLGGPLARCRYAVLPDGRSLLAVTTHHCTTDGKSGLTLMQELVAELAGTPGPRPVHDLPARMHDRLPPARRWLHDRRAALELVRQVSAERGERAPSFDGLAWHARHDGPRTPLVITRRLSVDQTSAVVRAAKAAGGTVYGLLASRALHVAAELAGTSGDLLLTTPVDLRPLLDPPADPASGLFVGIVSTLHGPDASPASVSTAVRAAADRGEAELFYFLVRADRVGLDARSSERLAAAAQAAAQAVAVSNLGVLDAGADPEWLTTLTVSQPPVPNQAVFVVSVTYRGRLTLIHCFDANRVDASVAARFVDELEAALR
jgi:hypothetical protein